MSRDVVTNNLRSIAARIINQVTDGASLSDCLSDALPSIKDGRDRAFVQALCYGVCRFYTRLDVVLSFLLKKPMQAKDSDVHALLLVGLYQIMEMRVPAHAAVAETVNATTSLKKPWARGFTNAILREYLRQQDHIKNEIKEDAEAEYAHPAWWIDEIAEAWPDNWQAILHENNAHPPFTLRVNKKNLTREAYVDELNKVDIKAKIIPETEQGLILDEPMQAEELLGFARGDVSVQDGAAQLAATLLDLAPNMRVLDACAAPGGKLMHILELEPNLVAIAVEKDKTRIASIKENLTRLNLQAECICADVGNVKAWWDGQPFDRILLDAPCSASGVVRRHPDIKLLRQPNDIAAFAREQLRLLNALWPLLKPNGLLVYATCSIFPEENVRVLEQFFATHPDAVEKKISATWGVECAIGRQILTGMHNMDGFYYACIKQSHDL